MAQHNYNVTPGEESSTNGIWAVIAVVAILIIGYLLFANRASDTPREQNNTTIEENTTNEAPDPTPTPTPEPAPTPQP